MGRGTPPGSAGVPPACTAVASRSGSLRCSTRRPRRPERHGLGRSGAVAGPARNLMGAKPAIRGRFLVERSKPSIAGFVSILPGRMRARRPRSRVGPARDVFAAGNLSSTADPMQGAPSLPLPGSYPLCQVVCGRDARAPGWAASLGRHRSKGGPSVFVSIRSSSLSPDSPRPNPANPVHRCKLPL